EDSIVPRQADDDSINPLEHIVRSAVAAKAVGDTFEEIDSAINAVTIALEKTIGHIDSLAEGKVQYEGNTFKEDITTLVQEMDSSVEKFHAHFLALVEASIPGETTFAAEMKHASNVEKFYLDLKGIAEKVRSSASAIKKHIDQAIKNDDISSRKRKIEEAKNEATEIKKLVDKIKNFQLEEFRPEALEDDNLSLNSSMVRDSATSNIFSSSSEDDHLSFNSSITRDSDTPSMLSFSRKE
ncbi:MAG: hypothetical protein ACOYK6_07110, partial [Chthoniobacterales bacterium]